MEFAVGHFLDLNVGGSSLLRWQNFWIQETATRGGQTYSFIPFGFSGMTTNRQGDNIDATLGFPNNGLSRRYALQATQEKWVAKVQVVLFDPDDKTNQTLLSTYVGQVTASNWGETVIQARLNSLIDAVGGDIPARRISQDLVGYIPNSANIQLF